MRPPIELIKTGLGLLGDGQHTAEVAEAEGRKLAKHGGDRRSKEAKVDQGSARTLIRRGDNNDYLRARLERDAPQVLADLDAGKHKSARSAAIAAGIIRQEWNPNAV